MLHWLIDGLVAIAAIVAILDYFGVKPRQPQGWAAMSLSRWWKLAAMLALVAASLGMSGYSLYRSYHRVSDLSRQVIDLSRQVDDLTKQNQQLASLPIQYMTGYGMIAPVGEKTFDPDKISLFIETDGSYFREYKGKFRLAGVAYHNYGFVPSDEVSDLCKSSLYDIQDGTVHMGMKLSKRFAAELRGKALHTTYQLLLVPTEITMDQFNTIKQAKALGVIVKNSEGGPP